MRRERRILFSTLLLALAAAAALAAMPARRITVRNMRPGLWDAKGEYVRFFDSPVASLTNQVQLEYINRTMGNFFRTCQENRPPSGKPENPFAYDAKTTVSIERPGLVTGYITRYENTGGAHPMTYYQGFNVGMVKGRAKDLALGDLFRADEDARNVAAAHIRAKLANDPRAVYLGGADSNPSDAELTSAWVLTPSGVTFLLQPYIAGPYAAGSFFVKVPFAEFGERLDRNGPLKPLLEKE
jgi:hypothetical protein